MEKRPLSQIELIGKAWKESFETMFSQPGVAVPFIIVGLIELIGLLALFFLIQPPLVQYIRPIVLRFYGEPYLHYPFNLALLSQFFYYLQIVTAVILGTYATGVTISATDQFHYDRDISFKLAAKQALFKYVALLLVTLIVFALIQYAYVMEKKVLLKILSKGETFLGIGRQPWTMLFMAAGVFIAGVFQSLFIFTQAAIMVDNKNIFLALFRNFVYFFTHMFAAVMLVLIPLFFYTPITLLKGNIFPLMNRTVPEIVFVILIVGTLLSVLINVLITIASTKLYLLVKEKIHGEE